MTVPVATTTYMSILGKFSPAGSGAWAVKYGDATAASLSVGACAGAPLTASFQGGISLGEGGDGSSAAVAFFEGVMAAYSTADATDNLIQANIAAFYGAQ